MNKEVLRDILFQKYFQIENGILISDLVDKLSFIPEIWKKLHSLCEKNIKYFDSFSSLEKCKMLEYQQKKYLIIKIIMQSYVIIDIEKMKNLTQTEFINEFNENIFINNFDEIKENTKNNFSNLYEIEKYEGNIQELVNFYIENKDILNLSTQLYYRLNLENAWTYFHIDFANANAQIGFQTKDKNLYEQLFLKYDLTPYGLQDAQQKIGIEKMNEFFTKIKDIKIPIEYIPDDLYQQYLIQRNNDNNKQITKKL